MLAQNFKTAQQLKLSEEQYAALCKTLVLMETGKLQHRGIDDIAFFNLDPPKYAKTFTGHFNMSEWALTGECGTVACIGGTAEMIGNVSFELVKFRSGLYKLFFPHEFIDYESITVEQAARALRNYLTCGWPKWREVLSGR